MLMAVNEDAWLVVTLAISPFFCLVSSTLSVYCVLVYVVIFNVGPEENQTLYNIFILYIIWAALLMRFSDCQEPYQKVQMT